MYEISVSGYTLYFYLQLTSDVSNLRVGLLEEMFTNCEQEVVDTVRAAVELLQPHVAAVEDVSIPFIKECKTIIPYR